MKTLVAGTRWSFLARTQGVPISIDMGATEDTARGEQRVPEALTFLRQNLLSTALAFRWRQLRLRAAAKSLDHLAKRPADPGCRDAPQIGGAE